MDKSDEKKSFPLVHKIYTNFIIQEEHYYDKENDEMLPYI